MFLEEFLYFRIIDIARLEKIFFIIFLYCDLLRDLVLVFNQRGNRDLLSCAAYM
jgi:hypothetical protein